VSDIVDVPAPAAPAETPPRRTLVTAPAARRLEEAKADLLDRAVEAGKADSDLDMMVRRYYRHVAPEDIVGRDPVDVLGAVVSHRRAAENRPQGTAVVHAFSPTLEGNGWSSPHTVLEIVTDDMPFLVDSVTAALGQMGRAIHTVIHPQFVVSRDVAGAHLGIVDVDHGATPPEGAFLESWMHIETDRETDPEDLRQIESTIQSVLRDVREAVEDWPRMVIKAVGVADALETAPPAHVDRAEVAESVALLRWLADEHFTFLGYKEYVLNDEGTELDPIPGTGLGIMRSDSPAGAAHELSPEVRSLAREPHILVLTKANSRSTVHRSAYLDYVGV
jgi:glutamate dehydrogenase